MKTDFDRKTKKKVPFVLPLAAQEAHQEPRLPILNAQQMVRRRWLVVAAKDFHLPEQQLGIR
jgi:hypothetical protein